MKAKDLREMNDEELTDLLKEKTEAVRNFHFQMATGSVDNTRGARNARRDVARIKTIVRERQLAAQREAN